MSNKDAFADRQRGLETEYFHHKERELLEKLRRRRELAEASGVDDDEILKDLEALGYERSTVALLPIVPLVQMAWADGKIGPKEREMILAYAKLRSIEEGTEAHERILKSLERRPPPEDFDRALRILRAMAGKYQGSQHPRGAEIMEYCRRVAESSGGILGIGRQISKEEQELLDRIAELMPEGYAEAAGRALADVEDAG